MGYPYSGDRVDVLRLAKQRRLSLETAAREARYACFEAAAVRFRCRRLILAHHADDQVETVLHHLFRGTGLTGLTGMSWKSERSLVPDGRTVTIIAPGDVQLQLDPALGLGWTAVIKSQGRKHRQWIGFRQEVVPLQGAGQR